MKKEKLYKLEFTKDEIEKIYFLIYIESNFWFLKSVKAKSKNMEEVFEGIKEQYETLLKKFDIYKNERGYKK